MPTRSSPGGGLKSAQRRSSNSIVAPSSTSSQRCCTSPTAGLQTSSTRTVDALRTLHEAVDEGVGDAVEHRADHGLQRAAAERVAQLEDDLAGRGLAIGTGLVQRQELPQAVEVRERAIDQFHLHAARVLVAVAGRERMPDAGIGQVQTGRDALGVLGQGLDLVAPGQELGIALHLGNQLVHLTRRVPEQNGLFDLLHRIAGL
mmetsp:Transcript_898/g.1829  ORF Transcript_898/g.1829 Transcript_898/m.1829 type:complete len:203 (+) Transcript_898:93-701(+)